MVGWVATGRSNDEIAARDRAQLVVFAIQC